MESSRPKLVGIVLCGGHSRRMGRSKALLPFGAETVIQRVVRQIATAVDAVVVVASSRQRLSPLPAEVRVVRDRRRDQGPLEGLAAGLVALDSDVEAVYLTACDVPLLVPEFITRVVGLLGDLDCAVPRFEGFDQPLAAAYRPRVRAQVDALLAENQRSMRALLACLRKQLIDAEQLRDVDPQLYSLRNCNTPAEYQAALLAAGIQNKPRRVHARDQDL